MFNGYQAAPRIRESLAVCILLLVARSAPAETVREACARQIAVLPAEWSGRSNVAAHCRAGGDADEYSFTYHSRLPLQNRFDSDRRRMMTLTDGVLDPLSPTNGWVSTYGKGRFCLVDLGRVYDIDAVRVLDNPADGGGVYGRFREARYAVQVWTPDRQLQDIGTLRFPAKSGAQPPEWQVLRLDRPVRGTRVVLVNPDGGVYLNEIEVYGRASPDQTTGPRILRQDRPVVSGQDAIQLEGEDCQRYTEMNQANWSLNSYRREELGPRGFWDGVGEPSASGGKVLALSNQPLEQPWAEWDFDVEAGGSFYLVIRYACGRIIDQDGGRFRILIDGASPGTDFEDVLLTTTGGGTSASAYHSTGEHHRLLEWNVAPGKAVALKRGRHTLRLVALAPNFTCVVDYLRLQRAAPPANPPETDTYRIPPAIVLTNKTYGGDGTVTMDFNLVETLGRGGFFQMTQVYDTFRPFPFPAQVTLPDNRTAFNISRGRPMPMSIAFRAPGSIAAGQTIGGRFDLRAHLESYRPFTLETHLQRPDWRRMPNFLHDDREIAAWKQKLSEAPASADDLRRLGTLFPEIGSCAPYFRFTAEELERLVPSIPAGESVTYSCSAGHPPVVLMPMDYTRGDTDRFVCTACGREFVGTPYGMWWRACLLHNVRDAALWASRAYLATGDPAWAATAGRLMMAFVRKYPYLQPCWEAHLNRADRTHEGSVTHFNWDIERLSEVFINIRGAGVLTDADYDQIEHNHLRPGWQQTLNVYRTMSEFGVNPWTEGQDAGEGAAIIGLLLDDPAIVAFARTFLDVRLGDMGADGWSIEGSMGYHFSTLGGIQQAATLFQRAGQGDYFAREDIKAAFRVPYRFNWPNGWPPKVHDNSNGPTGYGGNMTRQANARWPDDPDFRRVVQVIGPGTVAGATAKVEGATIPFKTEIFPSRGYAILRNDNVANPLQAFLDYGHNRATHAHADMLNTMLYACGQEMLRDLGNLGGGGYGQPRHQRWNIATASHNTVMVDGRNQSNREPNARQIAFLDKPGLKIVAAVEDGPVRSYDPVALGRALILTDELCVDLFSVAPRDNQPHVLRWNAFGQGTFAAGDLAPGTATHLEGGEWCGEFFLANLKAAPASDAAHVAWSNAQGRLSLCLLPAHGAEIVTADSGTNPGDTDCPAVLMRTKAAGMAVPAIWEAVPTGAVSRVRQVARLDWTLDGRAPPDHGAFVRAQTEAGEIVAGFCPQKGMKKAEGITTDAALVCEVRSRQNGGRIFFAGGTYAEAAGHRAEGKESGYVEW